MTVWEERQLWDKGEVDPGDTSDSGSPESWNGGSWMRQTDRFGKVGDSDPGGEFQGWRL